MPKDYFICKNCGEKVSQKAIGTKNRNHCPRCLWSLHIDEKTSGDRKSNCLGKMKPMGLCFKDEGIDKYGKKRQGEIMIIHKCQICQKETKNRIAGDDEAEVIMGLCEERYREEVKRQLFGDNSQELKANNEKS